MRLISILLMCSELSLIVSGCAPGEGLTNFGRQAIADSAVPVRPGVPGKTPFWNKRAWRFIYAPAFDFNKVENAAKYRFTVKSLADGRTYTFEADVPWQPLSPVWTKLAVGQIELEVEALDAKGNTILFCGYKKFSKGAPFNGPYTKRAYSYDQSGRRCLADVFGQRKIQMWLTHSRPDPNYPLWVHPTKIMGAVVTAMAYYSKVAENPKTKQDALTIARRAADFLLSLSQPPNSPLEYWPPTYWDGVNPGNHPIDINTIMTNYPASGAMSFLNLYDATGDKKYLEQAKCIADTYIKLQLANGTWYQVLDVRTGTPDVRDIRSGKPAVKSFLLPTGVIGFFDRLKNQYGLDRYEQAREKAFAWIVAGPVRTFDWQAQYEDQSTATAYKNLSHAGATSTAVLLLNEAGGHPEYVQVAEELLRFSEDLFVVWEHNDPVAKPGWFLLGVLEQYTFSTPIDAHNWHLAQAYLKACEVTGKPIYRAKAESLINTLTVAQQYHGGGEIPTHLRRVLPEPNWLNCSVYPAIGMIELDKER